MKKVAFAALLSLALLTTAAGVFSVAAEEPPEIEITWLSISGKPIWYIRDNYAMILAEGDGSIKTLDLISGKTTPGYSSSTTSVPIPFEHGQENFHKNSDGSSMGVSVADKEFKYGFVNMEGECIIPCEYDWVNPSDYAESFAVKRDGKWGMVDTNNQLIVPFEWDWIGGIFEERSTVARRDEHGDLKWGYIDSAGKVVVPLVYDTAEEFHEGLAIVSRDDGFGDEKCGYIDSSGEVIVPLQYDVGSSFYMGFADVGLRNGSGEMKWGCIDRSGNVVIPLEYDDSNCNNGLVVVEKDGKHGCLNTSGETVLPLEYDNMRHIGDGVCMVRKGASYGTFENPYWRDPKSAPEPYFAENGIEISGSTFGKIAVVLLLGGVGLLVFLSLRRRE